MKPRMLSPPSSSFIRSFSALIQFKNICILVQLKPDKLEAALAPAQHKSRRPFFQWWEDSRLRSRKKYTKWRLLTQKSCQIKRASKNLSYYNYFVLKIVSYWLCSNYGTFSSSFLKSLETNLNRAKCKSRICIHVIKWIQNTNYVLTYWCIIFFYLHLLL